MPHSFVRPEVVVLSPTWTSTVATHLSAHTAA